MYQSVLECFHEKLRALENRIQRINNQKDELEMSPRSLQIRSDTSPLSAAETHNA